MTEKNWTLRDADGAVCVPDIKATAEEVLVLIEASNVKQAANAPHHAVAADGARIESSAELGEDLVDEALDIVESALGGADL